MALRPGRTTRKIERPYTRVSKRAPRQSYVVGVPYPRIHVFEMGKKGGNYDRILHMISLQHVQIRDNALEASRIAAHKFLEKKLGDNFFLKVLVYPHHVLREKSIAMGAGADRYSQGMRMSFGAPKGRAVQIKEGQKIMSLWIGNENLDIAKKTLKRAGLKLPATVRIEVE